MDGMGYGAYQLTPNQSLDFGGALCSEKHLSMVRCMVYQWTHPFFRMKLCFIRCVNKFKPCSYDGLLGFMMFLPLKLSLKAILLIFWVENPIAGVLVFVSPIVQSLKMAIGLDRFGFLSKFEHQGYGGGQVLHSVGIASNLNLIPSPLTIDIL